MQIEILALRHQPVVLQHRTNKRARLSAADRHAIHFNVTAHPTEEWTEQQIAEAFPWDSAPDYLLHDRDRIYGDTFHRRVEEMATREILTAPLLEVKLTIPRGSTGSATPNAPRRSVGAVTSFLESRRWLARLSVERFGWGWGWSSMFGRVAAVVFGTD